MITLIVGTNRPGSNTRKIAAQIEEIYAELKVPLRVLDLAQLLPEILFTGFLHRKTKGIPAVRRSRFAIRWIARGHARIQWRHAGCFEVFH
jgi:NAD(P)H-dependent FMN reductase